MLTLHCPYSRCRDHTYSTVPAAHTPTTRPLTTHTLWGLLRDSAESASQSQPTPPYSSKAETLPVHCVEGFRWQIAIIHSKACESGLLHHVSSLPSIFTSTSCHYSQSGKVSRSWPTQPLLTRLPSPAPPRLYAFAYLGLDLCRIWCCCCCVVVVVLLLLLLLLSLLSQLSRISLPSSMWLFVSVLFKEKWKIQSFAWCICEHGTTPSQTQPLTVNRHCYSPTYSAAFGPCATPNDILHCPFLITHSDPTCACTSPRWNVARLDSVTYLAFALASPALLTYCLWLCRLRPCSVCFL